MKVNDVTSLFFKDLKMLYSTQEIKSLLFYTFKEILGYGRVDVILNKEKDIQYKELSAVLDVLEKLKKEIPIQYILGTAEFYGLSFIVNSHVLIPRPETEELVDWIIKESKEGRKLQILDIGTGSGCIAIALKKNIPESTVTAFDISMEALNIAKRNAEINNTKVSFCNFDILKTADVESLPKFDVIVSNPPYVKDSEKELMKNNVLNNEPHLALFVPDDDPYMFYTAVADFALKHLIAGGGLYFEINEDGSIELEDILKEKGFSSVVAKKDINGKHRMLKCSPGD